MKKFLASLIASILAAGGFVFMDATVPNRVETLEKEVSSLHEEISIFEDTVKGYQVGDEIACFPKNQFTLYEYGEGFGRSVTVTEFSAVITQIITEPKTYEETAYPYRGIATIKGTTSADNAGNLISFYFDGINGDLDLPKDGIQIKSDGSFDVEIPIKVVEKNFVININGVSFWYKVY